jgi:hypothetical protein
MGIESEKIEKRQTEDRNTVIQTYGGHADHISRTSTMDYRYGSGGRS